MAYQLTANGYALWPDGALKACGLALGIQDRKK